MKQERMGAPSVAALAEELLTAAHELLLAGWCQGAAARDGLGRPIEPSSAFARSWSAPGALERAWKVSRRDGDGAWLEAFQLANLLLAAVVKGVPATWNDEPDRHASEVLDAVASAVLLAGERDAAESEPRRVSAPLAG